MSADRHVMPNDQPLFDRIRELNAEVALMRKEAREDRAELRAALAATPAPLDEQPLFDRIRELNAEVALLKKEAREDRAEIKRLATPAPLDVERLARAIHPHSCGDWHVNGVKRCERDAAAIAAAYAEETE